MIETTPGPGAGPPLHHHDFDEAFYVIEGELTFRLRDDTVIAGPGNLVFAPRIAAANTGEQPPVWAQQPIPEVTRVGPPLTELAGGGS